MKNNLKEFIEIQKAINLIEKKSDITKKRSIRNLFKHLFRTKQVAQ